MIYTSKYIVGPVKLCCHEARERSEPFCPWFSKEKNPLHKGSYRELFSESYMVVDVVQNPQKSTGYDYEKEHVRRDSKMCCCCCCCRSAVVLRQPTKEYTHPYSMMNRGLPTAGIEVAPHYH